MSLRDEIIRCLQRDSEAYQTHLSAIVTEYDLAEVDTDTAVERFGLPPDVSDMDLSSYELQLLKRVRQLDQISLGLTVSGPAYQDNPILYANQTFRRFTGYELATLVGENPRLLQGPDSESDAVGTLREGIEIWEARTVELWNYRRDGSRFRNRVSVVPLTDESGMITNWLGIQRPVDT